ncbi:hypothetical protein [Pseudanabaena sp. FACHB-1998]|uniref:hypothetical protein n=1 Tax=Pseudanabaena sp. FACHB-1998 TaxID=2692858 RepID=UPI0018EF8FE1|nr:hypothetical protein [Pseudanabaena sp. FACHB-1998]
MINIQLVENLVQVIRSLSWEERFLLEEKLFWESAEISSKEIAKIAMLGNAFKFLETEPDIYTLEDGQPV